MSTGASFSGSAQPPGTSNIPISPQPAATPAPKATPAPTAPPSSTPTPNATNTTTTPIFGNVLAGKFVPDNMPKFIHEMPSLLSGLSPTEQNKFLMLILSSDVMNAIFSSLDHPKTRDSLNSLVKSFFDSGLLSQIAPDQAVLSEETQGALKDALQQKLVQTLQDLNANLTQKTTTPTTAPQEAKPDTAAAPQEKATTPTATGAEAKLGSTAESPGKTLATLNIPISQPGTPNQMPESVATLLANSITNALQQFFSAAATANATGANAAGPSTPQTPAQAQLATLLTSLVSLGITQTPEGTLKIMIPPKSDLAGFQTQVDQLSEKLNHISQELTNLGDIASRDKWNIGPLKNFVSTPTTLLAMLKSIQPDDTTTTNLIKTWVENSDVISTAILNKATEVYKDKFEFLKTIVLSTFASSTVAVAKEQQIRQQVFEQMLMAAPALLNVFKMKDTVGVFEEDIKKKHTALLYKFKRMLFNSAHEIVVVASGKPTYEYNEVGVFHPQLPYLAEKIAIMLPNASEEMDFDLMEIISSEITFTFKYIQGHEPRRINDILKRHPRTMLYLLCIDSPVTDYVIFPRTESLGLIRDPTVLAAHFTRLLNVVKSYESHSEFLKYQPKVFEAFIDEAKYDPTGDITQTSMDIIHKAIANCSDFIDLDLPD